MVACWLRATVRCEIVPAIWQLASPQSVQLRKETPWLLSRITVCNAPIAGVQRRHEASKNNERERKNLCNAKQNAQKRLKAHLTMRKHNEERSMTAAESRGLKRGNRVCWRGDATDGGIVTELSWDRLG